MGRKTIDFGIDLGTTNSVIACMDRGELVIIRNQVTNSEVNPSAVKMDARGSVTVGLNAYNDLEWDPDNAVGEFKRWMGNPERDGFTFKKAGKRMTAAELSAEVLKNLKGSAAARFGGEQVGAAVITVPAHFLIPACEDTKVAAKLAGIEVCPFLQEPVAAAMAYGYKAESVSGNLLVADLGMPSRPPGAGDRRSTVSLNIAYQPVSSGLDADIRLAIEPAPRGATVTVLRVDGGWSSGAIPVPASGKLLTAVVLRPKQVNSFEVQLNDARGSRISAGESSFSITQGLAVAQATTSRGLAIALADNVAEVVVRKGSPLPAKGSHKFATAHDVIAGDPKSILRTYFLEGEYTRSDRNIGIGSFELRGSDLRRTLLAGEDVEIRYRLDESKTLSAEAFFPVVNETCVMVRIYRRAALLPGEIDLELRKEKSRLAAIERADPESVDPMIAKQILVIEGEKQAAAGEPDAQQKAAQQILELKAAIDAMEKLSEWELLTTDLDNFRGRARKLSQASGTQDQVRAVEELIRSAEGAIFRRDVAVLRSATEKLKHAYWEINFARDDFWKEQLAWLREETDFIDSPQAERLKAEGARALKRSDIGSLRTIVWDLYVLLPTWQQGKLDQRFDAAGLLSTL